MKEYDICLASKAVRHKPYGEFQSLLIPTHQWKNLSIDFVIGLLILINGKGVSYGSILVIIDRLKKLIHDKPIKVTIDVSKLAKVIINIVIWYHNLLDFIIRDRKAIFTSEF